jgi:hypothetical protein
MRQEQPQGGSRGWAVRSWCRQNPRSWSVRTAAWSHRQARRLRLRKELPALHTRALIEILGPEIVVVRTFTAYIDESGRGYPKAFFDAGFMAPTEAWPEFSREWEAALQLPPRFPAFHAKQWASQGELRKLGRSVAERDARVENLIGIINKHTCLAFGVFLHAERYQSLFRGELSATHDQPSHQTHVEIMDHMIRHNIELGEFGEISFIFDKIVPTELLELQIKWDKWKRERHRPFRRRMGRLPATGDDEVDMPLQAADLLAWSMRRFFEETTERGVSADASLAYRWSGMIDVPRKFLPLYGEELIGMHMALVQPSRPPYENGKARSKRHRAYRMSQQSR